MHVMKVCSFAESMSMISVSSAYTNSLTENLVASCTPPFVWDDGEWRATCTDEEASQTARRGGGLGQRSTGSCAGGLVGGVHGRVERCELLVAVPRGSLGEEGAGGAARADDLAGLELEGLDEGEEVAAQWEPKGGGSAASAGGDEVGRRSWGGAAGDQQDQIQLLFQE